MPQQFELKYTPGYKYIRSEIFQNLHFLHFLMSKGDNWSQQEVDLS